MPKRRYVWVVNDLRYGAQAVFDSLRAARLAVNGDDDCGGLAPSGYVPQILRLLVRTRRRAWERQ